MVSYIGRSLLGCARQLQQNRLYCSQSPVTKELTELLMKKGRLDKYAKNILESGNVNLQKNYLDMLKKIDKIDANDIEICDAKELGAVMTELEERIKNSYY